MKKIEIKLTEVEARAVVAAIKASCDFSIDHYMFSPGGNYNEGSNKRNDRLLSAAVGVAARINESLYPPEGGNQF